VAHPGERRHALDVDPRRGDDVALVQLVVGRGGDRQEVEDPATAVVEADDRQLGAQPRGG
jgi:hypothetical protein